MRASALRSSGAAEPALPPPDLVLRKLPRPVRRVFPLWSLAPCLGTRRAAPIRGAGDLRYTH